jgi:hypothetical protein
MGGSLPRLAGLGRLARLVSPPGPERPLRLLRARHLPGLALQVLPHATRQVTVPRQVTFPRQVTVPRQVTRQAVQPLPGIPGLPEAAQPADDLPSIRRIRPRQSARFDGRGLRR